MAVEEKDVAESQDGRGSGLPRGRGAFSFRVSHSPMPRVGTVTATGGAAASIRHAEPQRSVTRNGVTSTPADVKTLLAEVYMYADSEFLGGVDHAIDPGTLHVVLCNWLGRGDHPVGMESALGEVVFNYPIYAYKADVKTNQKAKGSGWK